MSLTLNRAILILWKENGQVNFKTFMRDFGSVSGHYSDYKLYGGLGEAMSFIRELLNKGIPKEDIAIFEPSETSGESTCFIITDSDE